MRRFPHIHDVRSVPCSKEDFIEHLIRKIQVRFYTEALGQPGDLRLQKFLFYVSHEHKVPYHRKEGGGLPLALHESHGEDKLKSPI